MRDGKYEVSLSAYAYSNTGTMAFENDRGRGRDDHFELSIRLSHAGHDLQGAVTMVRRETALDHAGPASFSLTMIGSGGDDTFNLIGTGPRGIIVEIDGGWIGTHDEDEAAGQ